MFTINEQHLYVLPLCCTAFLDPNNAMVNLVVEYMDGGSLQDLVDRGGCHDEQALADITRQVMDQPIWVVCA